MYLSRAEQQMIEIAKAFRTKPSIMILDEPTASLTERETDRLFTLIETLKADGIGVIYITHRMNEIQRIGDRITVLRDGKLVDTLPVADTTQELLVELMTGRVIDQIFPDIKSDPKEPLLKIEGMTVSNNISNTVDNVTINVRGGEIVGIAGLVGSGKSEIGRACFGIENVTAGKVEFCGEIVFDSSVGINKLKTRAMLDRGLYYVPSDRREEGLAMMLSVRENMSLSALNLPKFSDRILLRRRNEKKIISDISEKLDLNPLNIERNIEHFSGGNQQKVLIGKALVRIDPGTKPASGGRENGLMGRAAVRDVSVFIFDEPTVGVDFGARILIYRAMRDLCESGAGVLLISSDLPEILHLAHRTYVMHRGQLRAELSRRKPPNRMCWVTSLGESTSNVDSIGGSARAAFAGKAREQFAVLLQSSFRARWRAAMVLVYRSRVADGHDRQFHGEQQPDHGSRASPPTLSWLRSRRWSSSCLAVLISRSAQCSPCAP